MKYKFAFSLFFIVPMLMGIIQFVNHQDVYSDAVTQSNVKMQEMRAKNEKKYQEIQKKLVVLRAKATPSDHDLWHIGHLEKTSKTLEKALDKTKTPMDTRLWANRVFIENMVMVALLMIAMLSFFFLQQRNRRQYPLPKGLSSTGGWQVPNDDSVVDQTHWQAMKSGGANFKTHKLVQTSKGIMIRQSAQLAIFYGLFIAIGLNNVLFNYLEVFLHQGLTAFVNQPKLIFTQWLTVGSTFIVAGMVIKVLMVPAPSLFDQKEQQLIMAGEQIPFSHIHALQVIEALAGGRGASVFKSYEMNLVLKNGDRIHLMDHGDFSAFTAQIQKLSDFLNVPIWKA